MRTDIFTTEELQKLSIEIHQNAVNKGFYEDFEVTEQEIAKRFNLFMEELMEAYSAFREGKSVKTFTGFYDDFENVYKRFCELVEEESETEIALTGFFSLIKNEGLFDCEEFEFADLVIRILDLFAALKLDVVNYNFINLLDGKQLKYLVLRNEINKTEESLFNCIWHEPKESKMFLSKLLSAVIKYSEEYKFPLKECMEIKMAYNKTRPYKHGKKF